MVSQGGIWGSATPAPAVLRAGSVLDIVAEAGHRPVPIPELAERLGIARSSVANVCAALTDLGFLRLQDAGFTLGHRLVELSGYYLAASDPVQRFTDYCRRHERVHRYTLNLATLEGAESMNLARSYGTSTVNIAARVGLRLPANCTALGKAMLAQFDDDHVRRVFGQNAPLTRLTQLSKADIEDVLGEIKFARENGYAVNDEEADLGVYGLAVAVEGLPPGEGPLAVSCSVLKASLTDDEAQRMLATLRAVAAAVSGAEPADSRRDQEPGRS